MFDHSIKVPRLYKVAAKYAQEATEKGASVKQLVYEKKHPNVKAVYALVVETLQRSDEIDNLLKRSQILEKEQGLNPWLARILITELLWRKKHLAGESKPVKTLLAYKQILSAHLAEITKKSNEPDEPKLIKPRYVRVNTLKQSVEEAINNFRDEGWTFVRYTEKDDYKGFIQKVSSLAPEEFMVDLHVKELLIFPPKTEFHNHNAYKEGFIMLQDKASCLSAQLLNPSSGSTVLDMCAAPGMKTTQLAALLNNTGTVFAVEFNQKRFETLNKMIEASGATCVKTINRDVITITEKECPNVEYILVDPSCSGSGILDRISHNKTEEKMNLYRLEKLAGFQIKILKHALNNFRHAKRVVYSTCSIYQQENEEVVKEVLASCKNYKLVPAQKLLNAPWTNFGSPDYKNIGKYCLYARPNIDYTSGFFVAVFERLEGDESNPHLVVNLVEKTGGKKRKRKRKNDNDMEIVEDEQTGEKEGEEKVKKKQKKQKVSEEISEQLSDCVIEEAEAKTEKKKKKRKSKLEECDNNEEIEMKDDTIQETNESSESYKQKKKKKQKK